MSEYNRAFGENAPSQSSWPNYHHDVGQPSSYVPGYPVSNPSPAHSEPETSFEVQKTNEPANESGFIPLGMPPNEDDVEEDPSFSYKGMQIVRGEYFSHLNEPSVTFVGSQVYVNTACVRKAPNVDFVQFLINPDEKKLCIRPSTEDEKDSFPWKTRKGVPKRISCPILFAMLVDLLGWDPECRYKILGKQKKSGNEYIFAFNLDNKQMYKPSFFVDENGVERKKASRTPIYNDDWKNQFGLPFDEHQKAFQVNIFDGYAVFGIKGTRSKSAPKPQDKVEEEE